MTEMGFVSWEGVRNVGKDRNGWSKCTLASSPKWRKQKTDRIM